MKTKYLLLTAMLVGGVAWAQAPGVTTPAKKNPLDDHAIEQEMLKVDKQRREVFSNPALNTLQNNFPQEKISKNT